MPTIPTSDAREYQTGYSELIATDIANYLKRSFNSADAILVTQLIIDKEFQLCSQCNRQFKVTNQTYFEYFDAPRTKFIPYASPVSAVSEIMVNGVDKTSSYAVGQDYFIYDNLIAFYSPIIASTYSPRAIKLTYSLRQFWGQDVTNLIKKWVAVEFLNSENGGVATSQLSFSELSQSLDLGGFEKEKRQLIFRYSDFEV